METNERHLSFDLGEAAETDASDQLFKPTVPWENPTTTQQSAYEVGYTLSRRTLDLLIERKNAMTDDLTTLYNRRGFIDAATEMLDTAEPTDRFVIFFADLDNFKTINDSYGHAQGDELLKLVGACLTEGLPGSIIGRFGGDEFAILHRFDRKGTINLLDQAMDGPRVLVEAAKQHCLESANQFLGTPGHIFGISVGASEVHSLPSADLTVMLHEADKAMYKLKPSRLSYVRSRP